MSDTLALLHLNIHSFSDDKYADPALRELLNAHDICILSECWYPNGEAAQGRSLPGFEHHYSVRPRTPGTLGRPAGGLSVYVRSSLAQLVRCEAVDNARGIIFLCLDARLFPCVSADVLLVACYLPPEHAPFYDRAGMSDPLATFAAEVSARRRGRHVMVVGDLNARTGTLSDFPDVTVVGRAIDVGADTSWADWGRPDDYANVAPAQRCSRDSVVNGFGRDCIAMCQSLGLVIANGRCMGDADGACTFFRTLPDGRECGSLLDLVLCSASAFHLLRSLQVQPRTEAWFSDHVPVSVAFHRAPNATAVGAPPLAGAGGQRRNRGRPTFHPAGEAADGFWQRYVGRVCSEEVLSALQAACDPVGLSSPEAIERAVKRFTKILLDCTIHAGEGGGQESQGQRRRQGAAWWTEACSTAKAGFIAAHRQDPNSAVTKELRRAYSGAKRAAQRVYRHALLSQLVDKFFSDPKDFWATFNGRPQCLAKAPDLEAFRTHFCALFNASVRPAGPTVDEPIQALSLRATSTASQVHVAWRWERSMRPSFSNGRPRLAT
jgi:hypothetical protein